jgi:hypothetical protein
MKRLLQWTAALVFLTGCAASQAQQNFPRDITISWTNASEYEDVIINGVPESGGPIEAGDLEFVRIEIYRQSDTVPVLTATIPDTGEGAAQTELFAGAIPKPGTYRIEGYSIVIGGAESDASESLFKKYTGKPRTITSVTIQ